MFCFGGWVGGTARVKSPALSGIGNITDHVKCKSSCMSARTHECTCPAIYSVLLSSDIDISAFRNFSLVSLSGVH